MRAPTQAGASRTREGAEEDKGKEGRGGRSGTCRFKGAEGRSGVGGCARGTRLRDGLRGVVCAGLLFWAPTPSKTFQSRSEKWGLQAILGTRALSSRWSGFTLHPLRADRWLVCAFPTSPLDFLRQQGLDYVARTRRCASGQTGGDFSLCSVLLENCRAALGCSRPGPGKAGSVTGRGGEAIGATVRGPRPGAAMQQFASPEAPRPPRAQSQDGTPQWTPGKVG